MRPAIDSVNGWYQNTKVKCIAGCKTDCEQTPITKVKDPNRRTRNTRKGEMGT
jgi:hypothetical protein